MRIDQHYMQPVELQMSRQSRYMFASLWYFSTTFIFSYLHYDLAFRGLASCLPRQPHLPHLHSPRPQNLPIPTYRHLIRVILQIFHHLWDIRRHGLVELIRTLKVQYRLRVLTAGVAFGELHDSPAFEAELPPVLVDDGEVLVDVVFGVEF